MKKKLGKIDPVQLHDLYVFAYNLGAMEKASVKIKLNGKDVPIRDAAYTLLQGMFNKEILKFEDLHIYFQSMKPTGYNEQFFKFLANKTNLNEVFDYEKNNHGTITNIYEWYVTRSTMTISEHSNDENMSFPTREENRFKILSYEETQNGVEREKWKTPTLELFIKEFRE